MTLRNRVSVAAALGVLIVVAAVSGVLYFVYAASVHSRVDATLIDAAQQASSVAQQTKQSAVGASGSLPDFETPVTVGSVELQLFNGPVAVDLLEDGAGLADPQAPGLVRAAREQAGELDQLITDLLDLARYHESAPHRETVRLDLLTGQAVHRLRQRGPRAVIEAEMSPRLVHVDPAAVDHAVCNLIGNAVKWSAPGAAVRVVVEDGRVVVSDRGPGIADEDLPHIFERFYRAPGARGIPGAGLGLAIVGSIAQANEGTVEVRTGPAGSAFTLAFPPLGNAGEAEA